MAPSDLADLSAMAQRYADQADADADEAFNEQHALSRSEQAAVDAVEAAGRERWRRDQLARAAAAARSGDGDARFGPLDDDEPELPAVRAPRPPGVRDTAGGVPAADDDEEAPQTWLR